MADKSVFEIIPSITVNAGVDPNKVAAREAKLHLARYKDTYKKQGFEPETDFKVEQLESGEFNIRLFVNLEKIDEL